LLLQDDFDIALGLKTVEDEIQDGQKSGLKGAQHRKKHGKGMQRKLAAAAGSRQVKKKNKKKTFGR
jgi:hypothetical protein